MEMSITVEYKVYAEKKIQDGKTQFLLYFINMTEPFVRADYPPYKLLDYLTGFETGMVRADAGILKPVYRIPIRNLNF